MLKSYKLRYKLQDTSYKFNQVHHSQDKADTKYQPQFCDYEVAEIKIYNVHYNWPTTRSTQDIYKLQFNRNRHFNDLLITPAFSPQTRRWSYDLTRSPVWKWPVAGLLEWCPLRLLGPRGGRGIYLCNGTSPGSGNFRQVYVTFRHNKTYKWPSQIFWIFREHFKITWPTNSWQSKMQF